MVLGVVCAAGWGGWGGAIGGPFFFFGEFVGGGLWVCDNFWGVFVLVLMSRIVGDFSKIKNGNNRLFVGRANIEEGPWLVTRNLGGPMISGTLYALI